MKYYKTVVNGYIEQIGTDTGGTKITKTEYNQILAAVRAMPAAEEGYGYRLKEDLTWELFELPEPSDDVDDAEALEILLGGAT